MKNLIVASAILVASVSGFANDHKGAEHKADKTSKCAALKGEEQKKCLTEEKAAMPAATAEKK